MANLSYCRMQNTETDLFDCYEHWMEAESREEQQARERILRLCRIILKDYGDD